MKQDGKKRFLGYSYVLHSTLMYMLYGAAGISGFALLIPAYAEKNGLSAASTTSWMTIGAFASCLFTLVIGKFIVKRGVRLVTAVSLVLAGLLGIFSLKYTSGVLGFGIASIFSQGMVHGYCFGATNTLITIWWPKRKGFMMGITTAGILLASMIYIPIMQKIGTFDGMANLLTASLVIMGVITWFWVRNTPEEVGCWPDNTPPTQEELQAVAAEKNQPAYVSTWNVGNLLKRRDCWCIILYAGLANLVTSGGAVLTVPFYMEVGFTMADVARFMAIGAPVSILGSFISGIIDEKLGPKWAAFIVSLWCGACYTLPLFAPGIPMMRFVSSVLGSMALGATSNLIPSLIASRFGRRDFAAVFRVLYAVAFFIRGICFLAAGEGLAILGSAQNVRLLYAVMIVIAGFFALGVNDKVVVPAPPGVKPVAPKPA